MATLETGIDYAKSGVDRIAADALVEKIALLTRSTLNKKVKAAVGGYASLYELDKKRWLAASTDGGGTKLKLAMRLGNHRTVGIDLVAMSVNDILCVGAEPLFFLDYFATGRLDGGVARQVIEGIVDGCKQASCALVGGETAEMPDFYQGGEYDLAGFAVGLVEPRRALPRKDIRPGDVIVGIASSGCHSNGYSLLRKLLPGGPDGDGRARELLTPTRIYARSLLPLVRRGLVKGLAHITGSGFLNIPRMSEKVSYAIELPPASELAPVFGWLRAGAGLDFPELCTTFNMGLGMVAVVAPKDAVRVVRALRGAGEKAWCIGQVAARRKKTPSQVFVTGGDGERAVLDY